MKQTSDAKTDLTIVESRVHEALAHIALKGRECALFYLDPDDPGDVCAAQREIERALRAAMVERYMVCAVDRRQLCIFVENIDAVGARRLAERLCLEFRSPRIGIALLSNAAAWPQDPRQLLAWAREACASASADETDRIGIHRSRALPADDVQWIRRLGRAFERDNFFLLFQPAASLTDGMAPHYEALLRLRGEGGEVYRPKEFFPVAERAGLMGALDFRALDMAAETLGRIKPFRPQTALNVNLSRRTFADPELPDALGAKLEAAGASPQSLIFDIPATESMLTCRSSRRNVETLAEMGCRFALDDFGGCVGALRALRPLPVDYVKFDGKNLARAVGDATDRVLIESMIDTVHRLGKLSVACFVEDRSVLDVQRSLGINYVQGHCLGWPRSELLPPRANPLDNMATFIT